MIHRPLATLVLALALVGSSCKGGSDEPSSSADKSSEPGGGGGAFDFPFAKVLADSLEKPGPYEEPRHSETYADGVDHWALFEIDAPIDELETMSFFSGEMGKPLRGLTDDLRRVGADPKVKGILLRTTGLSLDMATAEELRASIVAVRGLGKPVKCHTEGIANSGYYVLTACDEIGLAPLGEVMITGAAATPVHVKGLLDQVGVQADFLHVGDYKGAAEPLTREAPSPEMMETLQAIVDETYRTLVAGIVEGRKIDEAAAKAAIDRAIFVDDEAKTASLVDTVAPWETFLETATAGSAWTVVEKKDDGGPFAQITKLQRFVGMLPPERPSGPHVALVYAVGNVIDGKGGGIVGAREEIASRTLVATLRALARDEAVKAVVLRVSSPGGSALASEQIWAAVEALKAEKPVVVSMGGVAASGGYFISAGATKIYADTNTLTGSIGVVGGKIVLGKALERVGVKSYEVHRGERALMWSTMDPWSPGEREAVQDLMEATYERFLEHVAAGRKMERDAVHAIAQGRVWTGAEAKAKGLVDEIGGLDAALAEARRLGELDDTTALEVYPGDPTLRDLLSSFGTVQAGVLQGAPSPLSATLQALRALGGSDPHVFAQLESILELVFHLRHTRVWAVSFVRPPR
jgi:protease-4